MFSGRRNYLSILFALFVFWVVSPPVAGTGENDHAAGSTALSDQTCAKLQALLNDITEKVSSNDVRKWKRSINFKRYFEDYIPESDKERELYQSLVIALVDWGESVAVFRSLPDLGSLEKNKEVFLDTNKYPQKQEIIQQHAPCLKFPEFAYWNEVIKANHPQK
jgi:hypothetical protein